MRCFIAIEFDENTRNTLASIQNELKNQGVQGNYTRIENLHLTLKFLGEIDMPTYFELCNLLKKFSRNHELFVLELGKLGKFDKGNKKIVWTGLLGNKHLMSLFRDIESGLEDIIPIKKESRYIPHITLIREAVLNSNDISGIEKHHKLGYSFKAPGISLMESTRVNGRLTYVRRAYENFIA